MTDDHWMGVALDLAERARGTTDPNPAVGCVLVRDGEEVGRGWTRPPGGPHAEVVALEDAGQQARGATVYTTLEPCDHHGRTGPCSSALIAAGVARVVAACPDPSALAAGGARRLREAGVEVVLGPRADEAIAQSAGFFAAPGHQDRPSVTVKLAVSLDGRIAATDGTSQWLTGPEARRAAHALRAEADAVVVGSQTALADDPRLTVRLGEAGADQPQRLGDAGADQPLRLRDAGADQPLRVVLDGRARTRAGLRVYDDEAPSVAVVAPGAEASALERGGVEVWRIGGDRASGEPLRVTLAALAQRGVGRVLVEGGAAVAGAFLAAGLADNLVIHVAPLLLGHDGLPAVRLDVPTLSAAPRWRLDRVDRVGGDALLTCTAEEA